MRHRCQFYKHCRFLWVQEKLNFVLLSIWSHIPIDLSVWASNIVYQREIWSLPTGAVDTIFHGQSRITGKIARKNDKNKSLSLKLKYFLIAGAHNLKLMCSATYCNMTTNTPCFSRLPIDLTWQPVSAWHHASFWNRKRRWRHRSVRIVNCQVHAIHVNHIFGHVNPNTVPDRIVNWEANR